MTLKTSLTPFRRYTPSHRTLAASSHNTRCWLTCPSVVFMGIVTYFLCVNGALRISPFPPERAQLSFAIVSIRTLRPGALFTISLSYELHPNTINRRSEKPTEGSYSAMRDSFALPCWIQYARRAPTLYRLNANTRPRGLFQLIDR